MSLSPLHWECGVLTTGPPETTTRLWCGAGPLKGTKVGCPMAGVSGADYWQGLVTSLLFCHCSSSRGGLEQREGAGKRDDDVLVKMPNGHSLQLPELHLCIANSSKSVSIEPILSPSAQHKVSWKPNITLKAKHKIVKQTHCYSFLSKIIPQMCSDWWGCGGWVAEGMWNICAKSIISIYSCYCYPWLLIRWCLGTKPDTEFWGLCMYRAEPKQPSTIRVNSESR